MSKQKEIQAKLRTFTAGLASTLNSYSEEGRLLKVRIDALRTEALPRSSDLKHAEKRLDEIVDDLIILSQKTWEEYRQIESALLRQGDRSHKLREARELCQKAEDVMTSLLCFSLSYFRDEANSGKSI